MTISGRVTTTTVIIGHNTCNFLSVVMTNCYCQLIRTRMLWRLIPRHGCESVYAEDYLRNRYPSWKWVVLFFGMLLYLKENGTSECHYPSLSSSCLQRQNDQPPHNPAVSPCPKGIISLQVYCKNRSFLP